MQIIPVQTEFTRAEVEKDTRFMYLFTNNINRTSGSNPINVDSWYWRTYYDNGDPLRYPNITQAVLRGLNNAFPITTMINQFKTRFSDSTFDLFKNVIDADIKQIKAYSSGFEGIKYSAWVPFGWGVISQMNQYCPKCYEYMNKKLLEIGINNGSPNKAI